VVKSPLTHLLPQLRHLREAHGLTQEAFAERSGISYKDYQAVEAGRKRELRLSTLERLARAYGLEVWQLLAPDPPEGKLAAKRLPSRRPPGRAKRPPTALGAGRLRLPAPPTVAAGRGAGAAGRGHRAESHLRKPVAD
jgi:transcriptional regulator with XRE-family HTH domain